MIRDLIGILGFVLLTTGVFVRYGWDVACIISGVTLLTLAVMGALRK